MKSLKFNSETAKMILDGTMTTTWRIADEKHINVGDIIQFINKEDSGRVFARAKVIEVSEKPFYMLNDYDRQGHETYETEEKMYEVFKGYYGQNIGPETLLKVIHFELLPKESEATIDVPQSVIIHTDGGSRGNPGPSASGYVIEGENGEIIATGGQYLGITTNNQAEYQAVKFALEHAQKLGVSKVEFYMDSLLVVNQMKGLFQIKNRDLWPIHEAIKDLSKNFSEVSFTHVPREMNRLADAEVNRLLDAHKGQ